MHHIPVCNIIVWLYVCVRLLVCVWLYLYGCRTTCAWCHMKIAWLLELVTAYNPTWLCMYDFTCLMTTMQGLIVAFSNLNFKSEIRPHCEKKMKQSRSCHVGDSTWVYLMGVRKCLLAAGDQPKSSIAQDFFECGCWWISAESHTIVSHHSTAHNLI